MRSMITKQYRMAYAVFVALSVYFIPAVTSADDSPKKSPMTIGVQAPKTQSVQAARPNDPMMASDEPPPATLPADRFPQYQTNERRTNAHSNFDDGLIDFLLIPPRHVFGNQKPVHVRLLVQIDSKPFSQSRNERLASTDWTAPIPAPPTQNSSDAENSGAAETADEDDVEPENVGAKNKENEQTIKIESENEDAEQVEDDEQDEDDVQDEEEVPDSTIAKYNLTTSTSEFMRRYSEAVGEDLTAEEMKWLAARWTEGPVLLLLHPYFQSYRADQRPAFDLLDADHDREISKEEIDGALKSFLACDRNRDQIVDVIEISEAEVQPRKDPQPRDENPLLVVLTDLIDLTIEDSHLYDTVGFVDTDKDGRISDTEISRFLKRSPDVQVHADFSSQDAKSSKITLESLADGFDAQINSQTIHECIDITTNKTTFRVSGIQMKPSSQISLGAVVDGYPMLPTLDPNDDGRFTTRELRQLATRLKRFDANSDGSIDLSEIRPPIRVCIGLGATVHTSLAAVRTMKPERKTETLNPPDWFVQMDRNKDNDLSRDEFPGTDEQFNALDQDSDDLISVAEAEQTRS